jgi:hypothetical protein
MTNSQKIAAAVLVLFAVAALPRSQAATSGDSGPTTQSAHLATDGTPPPTNGSATYPGNPNATTFYSPHGPYRPWLIPLGFYTLPVLILAVILAFKHRRIRMMHDTLRAMIEKGMPVTPELVASLKPSDGRGHLMCYLLPGLICTAVGIGMMVNGGRAGLIPLLIGVAFLIAWQVEKRNLKAGQPPRE